MGWFITGCLQNLTSVGFPAEVPDLQCSAVAAKSRVFLYENLKDGGLDVNNRVYQLDRLIDDSDFVGKVASWYQWFRHSFLHNVAQAQDKVLALQDGGLPDELGDEQARGKWQHLC